MTQSSDENAEKDYVLHAAGSQQDGKKGENW